MDSKLHRNRFNYLLIVLVGLFIVSPLFQAEGTMSFRPILPTIYAIFVRTVAQHVVHETSCAVATMKSHVQWDHEAEPQHRHLET